jgi:SEC-C motif-containing protein
MVKNCPCGSGTTYGACCGRFHSGKTQAPTAEALMRSRFSAFVLRDQAYLLRSWHSATRPPRVDFDPELRYTRLDILGSSGGSAFHSEGTVEFRAHSNHGDLHENSRFVRENGAWVYLDGEIRS